MKMSFPLTQTHLFPSLDLKGLANYIISNDIHRILIMVGAGISTAAGIPDFRSPNVGIYSQLSHYNLADPSDVFCIHVFRERPEIFYDACNCLNLWPGDANPTPVHYFIRLLADHNRLLRCFTQNIDGLERKAGVPEHLLVEAHGTFHSAHCIDCHEPFPVENIQRTKSVTKMKDSFTVNQKSGLEQEEISIPHCPLCRGLVKPDIVFFGEDLPDKFHESWNNDPENAELLIIIGTSLQVYPFAALAFQVPDTIPRVVINASRPGGRIFLFPGDSGFSRASYVGHTEKGQKAALVNSLEELVEEELSSESEKSMNGNDVSNKIKNISAAIDTSTSILQSEAEYPPVSLNQVSHSNTSSVDRSSESSSGFDSSHLTNGYLYGYPFPRRDLLILADCQKVIQNLSQLLNYSAELRNLLEGKMD